MKNDKILTIAYMAMYVALYVVLKFVGNFVPFLTMPNGGSIEVELIALFIASYHLGWVAGGCAGILSWLITIVLGFPMYFVQPVQIFLDYAGPLLVCGAAAVLFPFKKNPTVRVGCGVAIAMVLKYCLNVLSGVYFWFPDGAAAGSNAAWAYSLSYNLWYNVATLVVCVILVPLLCDRLRKSKIQFMG